MTKIACFIYCMCMFIAMGKIDGWKLNKFNLLSLSVNFSFFIFVITRGNKFASIPS